MTADQIIEGIRKRGWLCRSPSDKGGPTRWGITQTIARAHGYTGDMRELPSGNSKANPAERLLTGPRFDQWQLYLRYWRMSFATLA